MRLHLPLPKVMMSRLRYLLITPTVLTLKLQMHHEMQHALQCSERKDHACCSWMRSSSAMFHSCSCISSCSASAAALSAAVCRCICAFTAVLLAWRQRETCNSCMSAACELHAAAAAATAAICLTFACHCAFT